MLVRDAESEGEGLNQHEEQEADHHQAGSMSSHQVKAHGDGHFSDLDTGNADAHHT